MKQDKIIFRLNRIEGQVKGVSKLLTKKSDLNAVIQQIETVKGALTSVEELILGQNFKRLAPDKALDQDLKQAISYLLKK